MKKTIEQYSKTALKRLPKRKWDDCEKLYDSILIMPSGKVHESGFNKMCVIGCIDRVPIEICSECSDDIEWKKSSFLRMDSPPLNDAIHVWAVRGKFKVGKALSSLEIEVWD